MMGRNDRQSFIQSPLDDLVEMVAVIMREHDEIHRRQFVNVERGFGQSLGRQPIAKMGVISLVQKVRVGQDREARVTQDHCRRPYEKDRAVLEVGAAGCRRGQTERLVARARRLFSRLTR